MYRIYADNDLIYNPLIPEYTIIEGRLNSSLNTVGTLTFTIPKSNPSYGQIQYMKSIITLYDDDRLLFRGRVFSPSVDLFQTETVECESDLAFFNDSVLEPYDFRNRRVEDVLQDVLLSHNAQVSSDKQFKLGYVTVTNDTAKGNIVRSSSDYTSTWSFLRDKLLKELGGYFYVRYQVDGVYLDYVNDLNDVNHQNIEQTINLLDAKREWFSDELATIVIPLGSKITDDDTDTERYVTIESVNHGNKALRDEHAIALYGEITKVTHHDYITDPINLLSAGRKDLADSVLLISKITLTAADLSKAGEAVDAFGLGQKLKVKIPSLNIDERMLVSQLSLDLLHPESSTLSIGIEEKTLTVTQLHTEHSIETIYQNLQENMKELNTAAIVRAIREANSYIQQSANEIKLDVSEKYYNKEKADELLSAVQTMMTQTSDAISFQFYQYKQLQEHLYGANARQFTELSRYIRFENGHIILGEQNSPIVLRIENERIVFLQGGVESAYWHNRKFYAVDGEYLQSLKLGKFAFMPRSTGNLSFTKVVN
ncbi:phage tail protein [Carnobacteriaceae bacterium zg-ZUI252]|nr:phage tail protein [Carnobacteriaceae bacterium zg-ZUI252]